jgi:hypothetical protein
MKYCRRSLLSSNPRPFTIDKGLEKYMERKPKASGLMNIKS